MSEYDDILAEYASDYDRESWAECYEYMSPLAAVEIRQHFYALALLDRCGSHYYSRDALKFFNARTYDHVAGGRFWVESIQNKPLYEAPWPRQYRVVWLSEHDRGEGGSHPNQRYDYAVGRLADVDSLRAAYRLRDRLAAAVLAEGPTGPDGVKRYHRED